MSLDISIEHATVLINGHRVQGWAAEADALLLPEIDLANTTRGPDGLLLASSTGNRGGEVSFKLLANSESAAFFGRQVAEIRRGARIIFEGSYEDQTGYSITFERGVFMRAPFGRTLGNTTPATRVFVFDFESIVESWDGVQTARPPAVAETA